MDDLKPSYWPDPNAEPDLEAQLAAATMRYAGRLRLHFNRHGAAPLVWCVATDDWELAVSAVAISGAPVASQYQPKATPDDEDGRPSDWLEVDGLLIVVQSVAYITPRSA